MGVGADTVAKILGIAWLGESCGRGGVGKILRAREVRASQNTQNQLQNPLTRGYGNSQRLNLQSESMYGSNRGPLHICKSCEA